MHGRSCQQRPPAQQDRPPLPDDPARDGVSRDLLRRAVLLSGAHVVVVGERSIFLPTLTFSWDFSNYTEAFGKYQDQILRSFGYAITATVLCVLLSFPLAYVIAFKAGRFKNLILAW